MRQFGQEVFLNPKHVRLRDISLSAATYGDRTFSAGGETFVWVEPQGTDGVTTQQNNSLKSYMEDAVDAMQSDDPENPETGYRAFIDTGSWIDEYLARTFSRDPDGLRQVGLGHADFAPALSDPGAHDCVRQ